MNPSFDKLFEIENNKRFKKNYIQTKVISRESNWECIPVVAEEWSRSLGDDVSTLKIMIKEISAISGNSINNISCSAFLCRSTSLHRKNIRDIFKKSAIKDMPGVVVVESAEESLSKDPSMP